MDNEKKEILVKIAHTIRHLSIDAVQKANSGHPGLPLGCAEIGAFLYGHLLRHSPSNPRWLNRDRFILSAGHGSMLLYSCLHLAGFNLSLNEIMNFRQLGSKTPGHPEKDIDIGIETTTGPLGQGIAHGIGHALGNQILAQKYNSNDFPLFDNKIFILAGDGCLMEGVASEAASFAGHLGLNNVVVIYDSNGICLDGPIADCFSEDVGARYQAYGWEVFEVNGHDFESLDQTLRNVRHAQQKPWLIIAKTTIGKGSPNKSGTHKVHGSPLGEEEVEATKKHLQLQQDDFFVPQSVKAFFAEKIARDQKREVEWNEMYDKWKMMHPQKSQELKQQLSADIPEGTHEQISTLSIPSPISGRVASHHVIQRVADCLPQLYGGSADLSCSDMTTIKEWETIAKESFLGRNIKFGVREFSMGGICQGLAQTGAFLPFCGTFLVFSDYMKNAIRLAALMKSRIIYQFTHDSIFLGEDGPTHQPIEHLAALRAIPGLQVIRPGDEYEVKMAWRAALYHAGPTALILSRQKLPSLGKYTTLPFEKGVGKGAYLVKDAKSTPVDFSLFASGSELSLALDVATELEKIGKQVRVISMPCWELFDKQDKKYCDSIINNQTGQYVSIEAGSHLGWHKYIGKEGIAISIDAFGASAPHKELAKEFGFTVEDILERILSA